MTGAGPDQVGAARDMRPARPGLPVAEAAAFATLGANSGTAAELRQRRHLSARRAGRARGRPTLSAALILARYTALGGAAGDFGMPISDEFVTGGVHQQNFEGGNITYAAGDTAAVEHPAPRVPAVIASPASVSAGGARAAGADRLSEQQHDCGFR